MKRYAFPLANVRRVRQIQQDLAAAALAEANRAVAQREHALRASRVALGALSSRAPAATTDAFVAHHHVQTLGARTVREGERELAATLDAATARRDDWALAARRVEGLDRLDARMRAAHELEATRDDDRVIDEIVTGRFGRAG